MAFNSARTLSIYAVKGLCYMIRSPSLIFKLQGATFQFVMVIIAILCVVDPACA